MHRKLIAIAALAVTVAALGGVGYAAIPGSNGAISACKDSKGTLKVIDAEAGQTCGPNQQPLGWNQQGPQGPAGPQGSLGISGWELIDWSTISLETPSVKIARAECPAGKKPLGGGGSAASSSVVPYMSHPSGNSGWYFGVRELTPVDNASYTPNAYVICATVQ
jgi:hypothetical protein